MFSFLQQRTFFFPFICSFFPKGSRVLLPGLPTSELHYYQQSAFKSAPAQHQDVFCKLILGDTDPSLLRGSLMPGVPETAGKTVSARRSAHTMGISGHHRALYSSELCVAEEQHGLFCKEKKGGMHACAKGGIMGG